MRSRCAALGLLFLAGGTANAGEWSGVVATELRVFPQHRIDARQHNTNISVSLKPEYYHTWDNGDQSLLIVPFLRLDSGDPQRTHVDLREFSWIKAADTWELRAGVRKVFWGVTESQHLVDIINQTDLVENIDNEDKLGQPMANLALIRDWGTLDLFVLPYFRERTFAGTGARLRSLPHVDTDRTRYESTRKQRHVDLAARWSHTLGDWDVGISHFYGTARDPRLLAAVDSGGNPVLVPYYDIIHQTSVDIQATTGQWLWKLEALTRGGQLNRYAAAVAGFEYTVVGVMDTAVDVGVLGEYSVDSRGRNAPTFLEDDIFVGARVTVNDPASSELLVGIVLDREDRARFFNLEASRRLGDSSTISVEARLFSNIQPTDPAFGLRQDDYLQLELARYF